MNYTEINKQLDRAKVGLLQIKNSAFLSTILFSLKFSWNEDVSTACTNGLTLEFNPHFFESLTHKERIFVLAHESWHVAFMHMSRMTKDMEDNFSVWNQACDHNINNMLIKNDYTMIKGGLANPKYIDGSVWSSEEIYKDLMENPELQMKGFTLDFESASDLTSEERAKITSHIEGIIIKASIQSRMAGDKAGTIPNEIQVGLDSILNPKLPWEVILRKYMTDYAKEDYSFKRPNKRFARQGVVMPSLYSTKVGHIACAVDTSCSVSDEQFSMFVSELISIYKRLKPSKMTIVDFDTEIHTVHEITKTNGFNNVSFSGRGGTDMKPVFEHFDKSGNKPIVLIMFSDMECTPITEDPGYPVIWIKLQGHGFEPSFGKVIDLH